MINYIERRLDNFMVELVDADRERWSAYNCTSLLAAVMEGVSEEIAEKATARVSAGFETINDIIKCWHREGFIPSNTFKIMYDAYVGHRFDVAFYMLFENYSNVKMKHLPRTLNEELETETIQRYIEFVPDHVLAALFERCVFNPYFHRSDLLKTERSLSQWFKDVSDFGWLDFSPYIYSYNDIEMLVLGYNRAIRFNGDCFGIYQCRKFNSYVHKGICIPLSVWQEKSPTFMSLLLWCSFVSVGCRIPEFIKLVEKDDAMLEEYLRRVAKRRNIKVGSLAFSETLRVCLTPAGDNVHMEYRLADSKESSYEFARLKVTSAWKGAFEVSNGVYPYSVTFNFEKVFDNDNVDRLAMKRLYTKQTINTLISGALALAGVFVDDKSVEAYDAFETLPTGHKDTLISIRTLDDIPLYILP